MELDLKHESPTHRVALGAHAILNARAGPPAAVAEHGVDVAAAAAVLAAAEPAVCAALDRAQAKAAAAGDAATSEGTRLESTTTACLLSAAAHLLDAPSPAVGEPVTKSDHLKRGTRKVGPDGESADVPGGGSRGAGAFLELASRMLLEGCMTAEISRTDHALGPTSAPAGAQHTAEDAATGTRWDGSAAAQSPAAEALAGVALPAAAAVRLVGYLEAAARAVCQAGSADAFADADCAVKGDKLGGDGAPGPGDASIHGTQCCKARADALS